MVTVGVFSYRAAQSWSAAALLGFDLKPVYLAGKALTAHRAIFSGTGFGYPPSAALLVGAPLSHVAFVTVSRVALVVGPVLVAATVPLAARAVGRPAAGPATVLGIALLALSGAVTEVLGLENVSILIALVGAAMFLAWSRGSEVLAGVLLGLTLALKPILAPLCLGLLVLRRWRPLVAAGAVALGLNLLTFAIDPAATQGLGGVARSYFSGSGLFGGYFDLVNSALQSVGKLTGWPFWTTDGVRLVVAGVTAAGVVAIWRARPEPFRSVEAGGLLLVGSWLCTQVFEAHWVLALVPFAFAAADSRSPLRWWPAVVGGVFGAELVMLPSWFTRFGTLGTATIVRSFGFVLVVFAVTAAGLRPSLVGGGRRTAHVGGGAGARPLRGALPGNAASR